MHFIGMAVIGLIVGFIARWIYPGAQHMSLLLTMVLGIAGSFAAGLIGNLIHRRQDGQPFHPAGFFYSIIGALLLIFVARRFGLIHG